MKHIGFVTCSDLSEYFPSQENPLLTHDDFLAYTHLKQKGYKVSTHVWTESLEQLRSKNYDLLVMRSPWDYSQSEKTREQFVFWLNSLKKIGAKVINPIDLMLWNLDKHYLSDMAKVGCQVVPSLFIESNESVDLEIIWQELGPFVVKPCISAAARDTYRLLEHKALQDLVRGVGEFKKPFAELRQKRSFLVQPYLSSIEKSGEWSLVFLKGVYSHSLLKKPKKGHWLVQDELGGSVHWLEPPIDVIEAAKKAFRLLKKAYGLDPKRVKLNQEVAYARVDIIVHEESYYLSELEMIEPELFFLDRSRDPFIPHQRALDLFAEAVALAL